ncbi:MAG: hypothetical protein FWD90_09040 [Defluviitaleaceae bacterium]|nr:hypothetical protein [Defluviitaleaceae bacterium]
MVYKIHMGPAKCAVDLGDGSERGEYVNQDYILHTLGRPHRAINLMYCYYPLDEGWPARASTLPTKGEVSYQWDYAYDDYFPYGGGLEGNTLGEPFTCMRDIRQHGQDVILTLTVDCGVSDEQLKRIAEDLRLFGRLQLRINHEATGSWFAFSKRYSYQEVADFYVRFHKIIKQIAPNIQTILCIGGAHTLPDGKMKYEDEFAEAIRVADIWSADAYLSLHWGWPYDVAEPGGNSHKRELNEKTIRELNAEFARFMERGEHKKRPFLLSETNADGDVNGPYEQAEQVKDFYDRIPAELPNLTGITMYQFRDRGRLGLEIEDPNNHHAGIPQPLLETYKEIIAQPYFSPELTKCGEAQLPLPLRLRWGGSEDAEGLAIPITFEANPVFCEILFENNLKDLSFMVKINGQWFYKKPGVTTVDLMSAFYKKPPPCGGESPTGTVIDVLLFATPPEGVNDPAQGDDWDVNHYTQIETLPTFRIRYKPTL